MGTNHIMNQAIQQQIQTSNAIPSAPGIVARLYALTSNPNYAQKEVAHLLESDPGCVAALLRLANSSHFGGVRKIANVAEAITRLGIRQVRSMVAARAMVDSFSGKAPQGLDISYFWRRSLATATVSSRLAEQQKSIPRDLAFTGGLLCDIGVIILGRAAPAQYAPLCAKYAPHQSEWLAVREFELLGFTHATVSAMALEQWGLPPELVTAVRHHHSEPPADTSEVASSLAHLFDCSSEVGRVLCEAMDAKVAVDACIKAMQRLGQEPASLRRVLPLVEADISELATALQVDVIPSRVYSLIAGALSEHLAVASS